MEPERLLSTMRRHLGGVLALAEDDDVQELYANPDGRLRLDTRTRGRVETSHRFEAGPLLSFLNTVAASLGVVLDRDHPTLQAELPAGLFGGGRLQAFIPPLSPAASFVIRKPASRVFSLDDYVAGGILRADHRARLREAVLDRENILVVGGTGTGKTTFGNALLHEISSLCPRDRLVILEDTLELQCSSPDALSLRSEERFPLALLVKATLRTSPDRIIVGEVRDGAALHLLDAWVTGHPGGVATLHATTPVGALHRLDRLAQRENVPSQRHLVAEAIDVVVLLQGSSQSRCVRELAIVESELDPLGNFRLRTV